MQENIQNSRVATSDAVVSMDVPAFGHGIFAIASLPSSIVRRNALLKFPSIFIMHTHFVALLNSETASRQRLSTLNFTNRCSS